LQFLRSLQNILHVGLFPPRSGNRSQQNDRRQNLLPSPALNSAGGPIDQPSTDAGQQHRAGHVNPTNAASGGQHRGLAPLPRSLLSIIGSGTGSGTGSSIAGSSTIGSGTGSSTTGGWREGLRRRNARDGSA
jgi:hypothetical protein